MVAFAPYAGTGEPKSTILDEKVWAVALRKLALAPAEVRAHLSPLFELTERGWEHVKALQTPFETREAGALSPEPAGTLLSFIEDELVGAYRGFALECADLMLSRHPDFQTMEEEASRLDRNLTILSLAVTAAQIPAGVREHVWRVADSMMGWYPDVSARIARAERTIGPLLAGG